MLLLPIKRRPRNPGICLLLLIAISTQQIAAKTETNIQMSPLILLLTATAIPNGGVTAQSPLLAPFNLFKTFFKNNPLRQESIIFVFLLNSKMNPLLLGQ